MNLSTAKEAPPIKPPSTFGLANNSLALPALQLSLIHIYLPDRGNYRSRPVCSQLRSFDRYVDVR